jgi:transcription antitermination factor NusG
MPVLRLEDNPPTIAKYGVAVDVLPRFTGFRRPKRGVNRWYVAQVKSQQERKLAAELVAHKVSYYLPMQAAKVKRGSDREVDGMRLMFPGYLFFFGDPHDWSTVKETRRTWQIIDVRDQVMIQDELKGILLGQKHLQFDSWKAFVAGRAVRFISGPMKGYEGVVEGRDFNGEGEAVVQLSVSLLGCASFKTTNLGDLELIDGKEKGPTRSRPASGQPG